MTSRRGPPSSSGVSCPDSPSIPAWRASTAPDLVGSITKQQVPGPSKTHSHHFAGPPPSRGGNTRHVVSSACGCHEPRDDRKSTRLNSSHVRISYAVFCLKKKKNTHT